MMSELGGCLNRSVRCLDSNFAKFACVMIGVTFTKLQATQLRKFHGA
jgi:hypothetical protein